MKHLIVGTAGHIDHGKSALVKALTGTDPDRLKEEKERGMTIDLGFAHFDLPGDNRVAFVDVPGHERFVKNMLAGAAGMDIVILVVDATESVMPQTREHLDIMKLLGVARGIVAITKVDIADEEMVEIVEAELEDLLEGTFLENAPVARVSAKTGEGIDDIREMIADAVSEQQRKNEDGLFRFPIDRVFTMKGFGTVVTGTVFSGWLDGDEPVHILPDGLSSRARQLQSHNVKLTRISAGMRGALNLVNISVPQLSRGDTLVRPGTAEATRLLDAKVQLLPSAPRTLSRTSAVKLYAAASQRTARMTLTDQARLNPGEESYVRLRLSHPLCIFPGDRFVLRGGSPEFTIAGGAVLDIAPVKVKKQDKTSWLSLLEKASREQTALAFLSQAQTGAKLREIAKRMGEPVSSVRALFDEHERNMRVLFTDVSDDVLLIAREQFDGLKIKLLDEVRTFFKSQPHRLYMSREELRSRLGPSLALQLFEKVLTGLTEAGEIQESREGVSLARRTAQITKAQKAAKEHIEKMFVDAGISPPTFSQAEESLPDSSHAKQMLSLLIEEKVLIKISPTLAYHNATLDGALDAVRRHFEKTDKLAVGDLKKILGVSRKHAVPLLEYFDRIGLTFRTGDHRILKKK